VKKFNNKDNDEYQSLIKDHFEGASGSIPQKLQAFPRFVSRQQQAIYLYKWELFKQVLDVHGSILEFGVYMGSGLFSFASFSSILEPYNYQRRIIGFDTFTGFPSVSEKDRSAHYESPEMKKGGFSVSEKHLSDIRHSVDLFDLNRYLNHLPKIELVQGDVVKTVPEFLKNNPHTLISLLYLDLDLYEPTMSALNELFERVVSGGIIAFDEINNPMWPGETQAFLEFFKNKPVALKKFSFEPARCYFVKK
jgi:hypothetical protein